MLEDTGVRNGRFQVTRRQLLHGAGFIALAAVLRPTAVFAGDEPGNDEPLGPFSDWSEPVYLGSVVNSPYNDSHPAILKNGLSLYFTSTRPGGVNGTNLGKIEEIWVSQRASLDAPWAIPLNLGHVVTSVGFNTSLPNISPDGHHLFFHSPRLGGCGHADLYVSRRKDKDDDLSWQAPVNLGCTINTPYFENAPRYFEDEETGIHYLYFASTRPAPPPFGTSIYVSTQDEDGNWGPGILVPELSSSYESGSTAIRRDGLEVFVTSRRPGGIGTVGTPNIWMSTRESTMDPWSTPVNLGLPVNSGFEDGGPALSWDATTMYFYSKRPAPDGFGGRKLWVTIRTKLHE